MKPNHTSIPSPCFVLDEKKITDNLLLLKKVQEAAGINIILAFKGFALWHTFPLIRKYLKGATASSLHEAQLCQEEMKTKAHTYAAVLLPDEVDEIAKLSSHLTFNSIGEYTRHYTKIKNANPNISLGIRVNPGWSPVETDLYNPALGGSRLGVPAEAFPSKLPEGIEGLHFHVLCESSAADLVKVLEHFEAKFGHFLPKIKWINMGGGHLMTRKGYDIDLLINTLKAFREKHQVEITLEPGSAVAWETGVLLSTVLDIVSYNGIRTAMLDVSFTAHMPDTLEMPYRPRVLGASREFAAESHPYRLGGISCLSGDYLEEYYFEKPLEVGDKVVLCDMMHYTLVKTTMFNGVKHPSIAVHKEDDTLEIIRTFGYEDYKRRMG